MTADLSHGAGDNHGPTVSTRLLHADRMADVGHGAVHAPMHTSVLYGYGSAQELQEVFQGHKPGFSYARQGNPTGAALEVNMAGECAYCSSKITSGQFDWVLSRIEQDESYGA